MRSLLCFMLLFVTASAACAQPSSSTSAHPRWTVDHYVYDASLKRDWAVLVDCEHPGAPARMKLLPKGVHESIDRAARAGQFMKTANPKPRTAAVKAGAAVEVSSALNAPVRILLAGTAMQTALAGQSVRVRLAASGRFIRGIALGPHSVELASVAQASWGKP